MITWTSAGAVERPTLLQIRVQRAYPGRVRAGAPIPTRSMDGEEIRRNLHFFTVGMRGPRSAPCERLVLSGVGVAGRADLAELLDQARAWGIAHVTLHAGLEDLDTLDPARFVGRVDTMVVPVQPGPAGGALRSASAALKACRNAGISVTAATTLSTVALPELGAAARAIAAAAPPRAALNYPFPISGNTSAHVPGIAATLAALETVVPVLEKAGVAVDIKGLPSCYLGGLARLARRSVNRWYVDADHQEGEAILFFPEVVSFFKAEDCRFCAADARCDGFFATYLRRPGFPALKPLEFA